MSVFQMNIRELEFKETSFKCLEADATWNVLGSDEGSYEVSPLSRGDDHIYAWQATYYTDNRNAYGFPVDAEYTEYLTRSGAILACQKHNRERCIAMIEEMLA